MRIYVIALMIVCLDQATKIMVKDAMMLHETIPVVGQTIQLTYIENPGMAFGIRFFETHPFWGRWFFSIVSVIASLALIWYIHVTRGEKMIYRVSLGLILGGAVGNLIDRVVFGRVVDFLDVDIPDMLGMQRWPVFNIADSAVVCGMILMTFYIVFAKPSRKEENVELDKTMATGE